MPTYPTSSKAIVSILEKEGFEKVSQKGSHVKMKHPDGRIVIVPHPKKDLPLGTVRNIFKSTQITLQ